MSICMTSLWPLTFQETAFQPHWQQVKCYVACPCQLCPSQSTGDVVLFAKMVAKLRKAWSERAQGVQAILICESWLSCACKAATRLFL